ncbi:MAG: NINE protein [Chitinophagales bacterium]|jgi:hypothetical protein|nr:TM2 domain-containing protein [Sphingobacteriales bacterium]
MKKFIFIAFLSLLITGITTRMYAAFPVQKERKEKKSTISIKGAEETHTMKISESKEEAKSELELAAASAAGDGGGKQVLAAVLCFFFGVLGVHDFVLGNMKMGLIKLGIFAAALLLMLVGLSGYVSGSGASFPTLALIGYLALVGLSIWVLVDFIRILIGKYPGL